jgi:hypothetical protein
MTATPNSPVLLDLLSAEERAEIRKESDAEIDRLLNGHVAPVCLPSVQDRGGSVSVAKALYEARVLPGVRHEEGCPPLHDFTQVGYAHEKESRGLRNTEQFAWCVVAPLAFSLGVLVATLFFVLF